MGAAASVHLETMLLQQLLLAHMRQLVNYEILDGLPIADFKVAADVVAVGQDERLAAIANPVLPAVPWADLARWINTPVPQRTMDPKSKLTRRQIAER